MLYALGLVLLVSCPLCCEGYRIVQDLLGRDTKLSRSEAVMEILYTTSQLGVVLQLQTALAMIQVRLGFHFHFIHFVAVIVEHIFFHYMAQFKFAWLHKLYHEVQPLYRLVHLEHHICKGVYPTTPAAGLWEVWMNGGTLFFCNTLACVPYFFFHTNSCGSNVVAHSMWPHKSCIQWHTLHHVAHSDVYAINVPSDNDEKFSRDVKQYRERLQCSPFIRYSFVSDLAGFAMIFVVGFTLHYCGIGLFHVWNERSLHFIAWKETQPNPRCAVSFPAQGGPSKSSARRVPLKRASRFFRDVSLGNKRGNIPSAPCLSSFSTNLGGGPGEFVTSNDRSWHFAN